MNESGFLPLSLLLDQGMPADAWQSLSTPIFTHILALLPDTEEKSKPGNHLTILLNFTGQLKRKAP